MSSINVLMVYLSRSQGNELFWHYDITVRNVCLTVGLFTWIIVIFLWSHQNYLFCSNSNIINCAWLRIEHYVFLPASGAVYTLAWHLDVPDTWMCLTPGCAWPNPTWVKPRISISPTELFTIVMIDGPRRNVIRVAHLYLKWNFSKTIHKQRTVTYVVLHTQYNIPQIQVETGTP